jgi:hypothetical protein
VARSSIGSKAGSWKGKVRRDLSCKTDKQTQDNQLDRIDTDSLTENTDRQERVLLKSKICSYKFSERIREKCRTCRIFIPHFMGWFVYGEAREKERGQLGRLQVAFSR